MRESAPTMTDVARAAGVSVMTVSNVLNGRPRVGADTRERVLEAVEELGYEVNLTAKRLRTGRTGTLGLIVPRFDLLYYSELAAQISDVLAPEGLHVVVEQSGASLEGELSALSLARLQQYDGVLLSPVGLRSSDLDRVRPDVPIVLLGEQEVPSRYDRVQMDNVEGGRLATAYLLECGARRIAVVGGSPDSRQQDMTGLRTAGWADAHRDAGLTPDPDLVIPMVTTSATEARELVTRRISSGLEFDAVFAVTDELALGVLAALRDARYRVPDDVQVIGFDDLAVSALIGPGLTSVDPGHRWIAEQALGLLREQMNGVTRPPRHLTSTARLAVRGSTRTRPPTAVRSGPA